MQIRNIHIWLVYTLTDFWMIKIHIMAKQYFIVRKYTFFFSLPNVMFFMLDSAD